MLQPDFVNGISALKGFDFTYDILIYPHHLPAAIKLIDKCPGQLFVLDQLGKPLIKEGKIGRWKDDISALASHANVYCKISGMVTEADWERWPMCFVAGSYQEVIEIVECYFAPFSSRDKELFYGGNAAKFYKL